jgi:hypothetical protein
VRDFNSRGRSLKPTLYKGNNIDRESGNGERRHTTTTACSAPSAFFRRVFFLSLENRLADGQYRGFKGGWLVLCLTDFPVLLYNHAR